MPPSPADWRLPPGVNRGLWDYLHDPQIARGYDASLEHSSLFRADLQFCRRHFAQPGRLIDLGCGTGRLAVAFAQRGDDVLAVDLSEEMLRVTGEKAAAAGVGVRRLKANLVELDVLADGRFDYAACLFSTLGMVAGAAERRRVIGHAHRLLRPGGRFVLHVHNRWFNCWDPQGRRWLVGDVLRSLTGSAAVGDRQQPPHQGIAGLTLHLFTRREAVRLLREAGFRIVEVQPVGLGADARLRWTWWFGWLRAYGYLIAAERPAPEGQGG
jgi:ubiquinone/menaquinone biosynthesis C-methylase UbiE